MKEKITRYSNVDAHNAIKQLMLRGERLVVRFFSENTQYLPCALVGTDNVKAFKYVIYQNSFDWLMGYLMCGKSYMEDIDAKPIMTVELCIGNNYVKFVWFVFIKLLIFIC